MLPSYDRQTGDEATTESTVGLLLSGGVDSALLLAELSRQGRMVQPIYVSMGCVWEQAEKAAVRNLLTHCVARNVLELVELSQPVADLYGPHWSTTGQCVPDASSPDEAVYLLGRNPLLLLKPMLWCSQHGIGELALGTLSSNPFADAAQGFLESFAAAMQTAVGTPVRIVQPLAEWTKSQLVSRAAGIPLELTFSCLMPVDGLHCGSCNKCAERRLALRCLPQGDTTQYAEPALTATNEH